MWDSGKGICIGCGKEADRDIAGRCEDCFRAGVRINQPSFKEMVHLEGTDTVASVAHIKDLESRRYDPQTKKMYYDKGKTIYFH